MIYDSDVILKKTFNKQLFAQFYLPTQLLQMIMFFK